MTYIKGGWVSNTDVIILYIHNLLLKLAYILFHGEKGVNITCFKPNSYDLTSSKCVCTSNVVRFYAEIAALETKLNMIDVLILGGGWVG